MPERTPSRKARAPRTRGVSAPSNNPGSHGKPASHREAPSLPPIGIVVSRYNWTITQALLNGAVEAYFDAGGDPDNLSLVFAPGAFEVVTLSSLMLKGGGVAGVVALGCIIKGETIHDQVLGNAVTTALADLSSWTACPVGLGVLTVNSVAQARARAGFGSGPGVSNKGAEAMRSVLVVLQQMNILTKAGGVPVHDFFSGQVQLPLSESPDKAHASSHRGKRS
ncbi:MAG: 6,7-dimethyl-8-ribityllumazine synthase [Phycisphaerales bacterium]|nr:6,7-dimethyl-8-ribityllumazine synthase [Phycisphaerales bacterium]